MFHLEDVWFKTCVKIKINESGRVSVSMKVSATDSQNVTAGLYFKGQRRKYIS